MSSREVSHYVVTAHPPGGILHSVKCNFLAPDSEDVVIAKSRRLEVRQLRASAVVPNAPTGSGSVGGGSAGEGEGGVMTTPPSPTSTGAGGGPGTITSTATTTATLTGTTPFPVVWSVPINGRITSLVALKIPSSPTSYLFLTTDQLQYAVIGYNPHATPYPVTTHAAGSLQGEEWNILGRPAECGPLVSVDPHNRCILLHLYDGLLTVFPIQSSYMPPDYVPPAVAAASATAAGHSSLSSVTDGKRKSSGGFRGYGGPGGPGSSSMLRSASVLSPPFHARMEERTVLSLTMLHHFDATITPPHVCLLHQDSRGAQHITTHAIDLQKQQVWFLGQTPGGNASSNTAGQGGALMAPASSPCEWLKKSRIDGGSSLLIPVPPRPPPAAAAAAGGAVGGAPPSQSQHPGAMGVGGGFTNPNAYNNNNYASNHHSGGVVILGQRQITYCALNHYKVMPIPPALLLSWDYLPPDVTGNTRYLISDEFGNLHMLTLITSDKLNKVIALQLDTLGSCTLSNQLVYLNHGLVFCGSTLGDSQLIQIHDEPIPVDQEEPDDSLELGDTTYLSVVEEYTHLGPIVDFDLVPTTPGSAAPTTVPTLPASSTPGVVTNRDATAQGSVGGTPAVSGVATTSATTPTRPLPHSQQQQFPQVVQSQVVTASGSSKSGTVRVIRNGIGMKEYASVELGGIQNMWSLRNSFDDTQDAFLVQSFVGETRVLGVANGEASSRGGEDEDLEGAAAVEGGGGGGVAPMEQEESGTKDDAVMGDSEEVEDGDSDEEEEEVGGTLEEVVLPGLESNASTLYVGNVVGDLFLQITESQLRLASNTGDLLDTWSPPREDDDDEDAGPFSTTTLQSLITVASANEAGQIVIALRGGLIMYFCIREQKLCQVDTKRMDREVSCINVNPFTSSLSSSLNAQNNASLSSLSAPPTTDAMDVDGGKMVGGSRMAPDSKLVAVGLWDDFTVRLLSLETSLAEIVQIHLSTSEEDEEDAADSAADAVQGQRRNRNNMMARSLCLITLDFHHSSSGHSGSNANGGGTTPNNNSSSTNAPGVNMLFVGLGDGTLVSFAVVQPEDGRAVAIQSKKEVSLGTQRINLVPLRTERGGTCVLATGDRPTVIYLAGIGGSSSSSSPAGSYPSGTNSPHFNPKLCYSNVNLSTAPEDDSDANDVSRPHAQQSIAVNVAAPFYSPLLFDAMGHNEQQQYSLCVADDANLRLGVIDDIQKLHVTTCRLGMAPRRIVHCPDGRLFAVGCIESGIKEFGLGGGEMNMGNLIRFLDDTTLDDIDRIHMDPCEMVLSMVSATMRVFKPSSASAAGGSAGTASSSDIDNAEAQVEYRQFLVIGTAYAMHDEDEPTKGRILVLSCNAHTEHRGHDVPGAAPSSSSRAARIVTELQVRGGVYSMCQFYEGRLLATVNSKTHVCQMVNDGTGVMKLSMVGVGHHGHILSLFVKSRAENMIGPAPPVSAPSSKSQQPQQQQQGPEPEKEMLAVVGDMMRSISLVQYYPQHETLEEVARDFNANWTTAVEMLTNDVYLGGESWNNLFVLRRNTKSQSEEVRCRLDTVGEFHLGEMCNKFMSGSLVMPQSTNSASNSGAAVGRSLRRSLASPKKLSQDSGKPSAAQAASAAMRSHRPVVVIGSQTLFGTVDGTLGVILGLDGPTSAFFAALERSMDRVIQPVGDFSHQQFRAFNAEQRVHPRHGFVDGDLVESFLDLDRRTMELVAQQMNRDGGWEVDDSAWMAAGGGNEKEADGGDPGEDARSDLTVEDILAVVEEIVMLH